MRNTIIVTILLFIAVIIASIFYFSDLDGEHKDAIKPLKFLPHDTYLIAGFQNNETTANIFRDFEIFEALIGKKQLGNMKALHGRLQQQDALQPYIKDVELYVSLHPEGDSLAFLFTIPLQSKLSKGSLESALPLFANEQKITHKDTLDSRIYSFATGDKEAILNLVYHKDILFASYSDSLVFKIVNQKSAKLDAQQIDYFVDNNSRNSPLSIYFAHQQITGIAKHFLRDQSGEFVRLFSEIGGESAWNLNYKNDALILSGESKMDPKQLSYLGLFAQQEKTIQKLYNYFPENTALYLEYSLSNKALFQSQLTELLGKRKEWEKLENQFAEMEKTKKISLKNDINPLFGNNFALVELSNQTNIAFLSLSDSLKFKEKRSSIATAISDGIYRFNSANLLYALYGDAFKSFRRPYFTQIGTQLIMANSQSELRDYLKSWQNAQLLVSTLGFKNFEKTHGNEANITYFLRTKASSGLLNSVLKRDYAKKYKDKDEYGYQDFFSWSVQISGNKGDFFSNIYGIYKSSTALGVTPEWTYEFNNRPITQPWVFEHSDTSQFILIQEQDHTIHGIHPSGKKLWSAVFAGRVVGDIQQLDDRSLYLVTDRSQFYRFNTEGSTADGFSTSLPNRPTGRAVYAKIDQEELFFIPAGDRLLAYDLNGNTVGKWKDMDFDGQVLADIHVFQNTVYLGTDQGSFYAFNKNGDRLNKVTVPARKLSNSLAFLAMEPAGSMHIMAIDTAGIRYDVDMEKSAFTKKSSAWKAPFYAAFSDVSGSETPELVLLGNKQLAALSLTDSSSLFKHTFTQSITDKPQFFKSSANRYLIGVASKENRLIYLFGDNGTLLEGFPIEAQPNFYYGKIDYNSSNFLLCVRKDRKLYAFKN